MAGGSAYYAITALLTLISAALLWRGSRAAVVAYLPVVPLTIVWAWSESALSFWLLIPRLAFPLAIGLVILLACSGTPGRRWLVGGAVCLLGAMVGLAPWERVSDSASYPALLDVATVQQTAAEDQWSHFAGTPGGERHTMAQVIKPDNVDQLELLWHYRTGELNEALENPQNLMAMSATPLKVNDSLVFCTPRNRVISLEIETGEEKWRFDPQVDGSGSTYLRTCRGVAYHASGSKPAGELCNQKIVSGTVDGRLIALDARTGQLCEDFADGGEIELTRNLGPVRPGYYGVTSPPMIVNDTIIVGAAILDNIDTDMPSGVIRAFDADTGLQLWSYDTGSTSPVIHGKPPREHVFSRGSPNAWAPFSADSDLGMVYVPTGNPSPDYYSEHRSVVDEAHGSALLALSVATGELVWRFKTVRRDHWDYDLPTYPVLLDIEVGGEARKALAQLTKQGEIFLLDRVTGEPLSAVEDLPVATRATVLQTLSPTQPRSVSMPHLRTPTKSEADMWGITPFDQVWCRKRFIELQYHGMYTPLTFAGSLQYPNQMGVSNWGKLTHDPQRQMLVMNTVNLTSVTQLFPRETRATPFLEGAPVFPQRGTPYKSSFTAFVSPLGIPCNAPPWGELVGLDLRRKEIVWRKPLGVIGDRFLADLPLHVGTPNVGGPLSTASGLTFIAATDDRRLRAYETVSGKLLWSHILPASAQSSPMSFVDGRSGRQYLVVVAGGDARLSKRLGDHVLAFTLKSESTHR
jgi:membrane-bound PQQ-dependent dehydrogenase (glucose/quinate/shikimate family)